MGALFGRTLRTATKRGIGIGQSQIQQNCPICQVNVGKRSLGNGLLSHLGQKHNEVEKYLSSSAKVPETLKRKKNVVSRKMSKRQRQGATRIKTKRPTLKKFDFPSVPEGFNPVNREIIDTFMEEKIIVDGYEISNEFDSSEEWLYISRGSKTVKKPQCNFTDEESATCQVCQDVLENVLVAVEHVHEQHGIQGRSKDQLLDIHNLVNAGYIVLRGGDSKED